MMMQRRCIADSSRRRRRSRRRQCKRWVVLHILSWGSMALIPIASEALPILMMCVLLSNLDAAITEVAKGALVAEYGQKKKKTK
ncbi:putative biopterin transporter family [Helianthus anomalus]